MKRRKKIHTGVCITDKRIVCVTAHVENKTMVITDANAVHLLMRMLENLLKCMI